MRYLVPFAATFLFASVAEAHTGAGTGFGFTSGFLHPFGGIDHALAMFSIGLLGYLMGGRAIWMVPGAFLVLMGLGGVVGLGGAATQPLEIGLAVSVMAAGGAVVVARNISVLTGAVLAGAFAVFHGFAHGAEIPATVVAVHYGLGFLCATAMLHLFGAGAGYCLERFKFDCARLGGAAISLVGVSLLAAVLW